MFEKASAELTAHIKQELVEIQKKGQLPMLRSAIIEKLLNQGHPRKVAVVLADLKIQEWTTHLKSEVN